MDAHELFDEMPVNNLCSYDFLISGYARMNLVIKMNIMTILLF